VLVGRLFRGDSNLVVVSGEGLTPPPSVGSADLGAPTLHLPYPRLRGYRLGFAPVLGALSGAWLAWALVRVLRFFKSQRVDHVVSIPHSGPFALLGILAARRLRIPHTLYILDAWEEAATGPVEAAFVRRGIGLAARMPRSRLAVVSPTLGAHYRRAFGFADVTWIPNPGPLAGEQLALEPQANATPFALFTGIIKPFNLEALRLVMRSLRECGVIEKLIITGHASISAFADPLRPGADDRIECRLCSPAEIAALQRQAAVLLVATNVDDRSQTALGYLPGRLPEYVSTRRPILLLGPPDSDAARAVRHWHLGETTASRDEKQLAKLLDACALRAMNPTAETHPTWHDLFLEIFSRGEARRRLLGETPEVPVSSAAATLAASFELPSRDEHDGASAEAVPSPSAST
jgi:hypothetical protein